MKEIIISSSSRNEINKIKMKVLSEDQQKSLLAERRRIAVDARQSLEGEWQSNEVTVYDVGMEGGALKQSAIMGNTVSYLDADAQEDDKGGPEFMAINLISRNKQLLHSQLCSNPPAVMAVPESSEDRDRDASIAAEHICSYVREHYNLVDAVALATNSVFDYGTGFIKNIYDGSLGEILEYDEKEGTLVMEGDNSYSVPRVWDIHLDPNATNPKDVKWIFEDIFMTLPEAIEKFGEEHKERLEKEVREVMAEEQESATSSGSMLSNKKYKILKICEYWETGLPENCYQGRHGYCLQDGYILKPLCPSPCRFKMNPRNPNSPTKARLPYSILTFIDIPGSAWGRSPVAHTSRMQEMLNNCVSVMISTAEVVGIPRILLPKQSVDKDTITNSAIDIMQFNATEGVPPHIIQAANVSQDINNLILKLEQYINDGWGVNDAMFGKQQREQAALLMQLSTMQGNLIRQRLYDKYILFVKDIYDLQLLYCVEYWETSRTIQVVGENNTLQVAKLRGADLLGGYSLKVEYGQAFALDPITRTEQILKSSQLYLQAGMTPRELVQLLRITDLRGKTDEFRQADDRAKEIIERIKALEMQVEISSKYQDHIGIIAYMKKYTMNREFEELEPNVRNLITEHIDTRIEAELQNTTGGAAAMGQPGMIPPLAAPGGIAPPAPAAPMQ
jgi:hypothetical protein